MVVAVPHVSHALLSLQPREWESRTLVRRKHAEVQPDGYRGCCRNVPCTQCLYHVVYMVAAPRPRYKIHVIMASRIQATT